MDVDKDVPTVLASFRAELEELTPLLLTIEDFWERKLWHQLTQALNEFYENESSQPLWLPMFTQVIAAFESKINQRSLVAFAIAASSQCKIKEDARAFLQQIAEKVNTPEDQDAYVYASAELAMVEIRMGLAECARDRLDKAQNCMDSLDGVDQRAVASIYRANAEFFRAKMDFNTYYRHALLYLSCIELKGLPHGAAQQLAYDLCIAALLGDRVYNFGELLLHPILDTLRTSEYEWLISVVSAINSGDVSKFEKMSAAIEARPVLQSSLPFLRSKICLTSLMETIFNQDVYPISLSFSHIARETRLVENEVEHLVMKGFSLGLLKGRIDQVEQRVYVTWLRPRVLNLDQVGTLCSNINGWLNNVTAARQLVT